MCVCFLLLCVEGEIRPFLFVYDFRSLGEFHIEASSSLETNPSPPSSPIMPDTTTHNVDPFDHLHQSLPKDLPLWEKIARTKRASRDAALPPEWRLRPDQISDDQLNVIHVPIECGILTTRELEITETDAVVLVQKLISREYSSHEVTLAFCKRAAIAQQLVRIT